MHLGAKIVQSLRLQLTEFGDTPGGRDERSWEMQLEAVIERVWRYALGGRNRVCFEMHMEAMMVQTLQAMIERVWR